MFLIKRSDGQHINFDAAELVERHGDNGLKLTLSGNKIYFIRDCMLGDIWQEKRKENFWLKAEWQSDQEVRLNSFSIK